MKRTPVKIRVIYADTDALGIVYHTNYIRWFEIGRTELLREVGILYKGMEGFNLPLTQAYCHYHFPARYDDIVLLETDIDYLKRASMKFTYRIWDENRCNLLAEGYTVHACTDRNGKILRIPAETAAKIRKNISKSMEQR
ncbi:MAG: acyl-CoA thioesterase [Proteobacteria bacterium]|nr:acyl-CoA thioesterase [Pseudomonadota bacterium]